MVLHANPRILFPLPRQYRRGLCRFMHLHENYPIKRAGVAGRALRASDSNDHITIGERVSVDVEVRCS